MRPDLDDFEELEEGNGSRSRALSWLVLAVAVGGFAALAYYAYHSGSQSMRDGSILVVEADQSPIKETPADVGGEQFANKDKTIYDAITPESQAPQTEKLLPEPEAPVIPEPAVNETETAKPAETTTYINKAAEPKEEAIDPVDAQSMKQGGPAPTPEPTVLKSSEDPVEVSSQDVAIKAVPVPEKAPAVVAKTEAAKPSAAAPAMVNVESAKPVAKPVVKPVVKPTPKPTAAPAATGNYKIQLGALGSEAEARQLWSKVTAKNGDVVKGSPIIIKADVNGKTYYRLRATGFASADAAKKACATLGGRGQACMPAGQ